MLTKRLFLTSQRYFKKHPLQNVLLMLGIALGVGVVVSIDLANKITLESFKQSSETISGRTTHQIVGSGTGVDERIFTRLRKERGVRLTAPLVEGYVVSQDLGGTVKLLGIDPLSERPFRNFINYDNRGFSEELLTQFLTIPGAVLLEADTAERAGISPGDEFTVRYGSVLHKLKLTGYIDTKDDFTGELLKGLILADISTAQEVLGLNGRLSRIDLIIDRTDGSEQARLEQIREILPLGVRIVKPESRSAALQSMGEAFELNLFALSLLALVIGAFLIYNTLTFSFVQRREQFAILRTLGVTRRELFALIILEAGLVGIVGSSLGIVLGIFLTKGVLLLITRTINDLYYTLPATGFILSGYGLLKGAFLGIGVSLIAGLAPGLEAARTSSFTQLRRQSLESRFKRYLPWVTLVGVAFGLGGYALLAIPSKSLTVGFGALFAILMCFALSAPFVMGSMVNVLIKIFSPYLGTTGVMSLRNIVRSMSRTAVALSALMVAVSVIVSVDIMIGSFRQTLNGWLEDTIGADVFISMPDSPISGSQGISRDVAGSIGGIDGVSKVFTARRKVLLTESYGPIEIVAVSGDIASERRFAWSAGGREEVWERVTKGGVMVSESFINKRGLDAAAGLEILLPTEHGLREFPVAAVFYDFSNDFGSILIHDDVYRKFWTDELLSSIALRVAESGNLESVIEDVKGVLGSQSGLVVQSRRALRESALKVFDRTFTITVSLRLLASIVAFLGIFTALMSLELERKREVGIMRSSGMTTGQLFKVIMGETGVIGAIAGIIAIPAGLVLAMVLIYEINLRSFGWSLELFFGWRYVFEALSLATISALMAGIYPAYRLSRTNIAEALKSE